MPTHKKGEKTRARLYELNATWVSLYCAAGHWIGRFAAQFGLCGLGSKPLLEALRQRRGLWQSSSVLVSRFEKRKFALRLRESE